MRRESGTHVRVDTPPEPFRAFVPKPLPPEPPLQLDAALQALLDQANFALGRLDGAASVLPDSSLFLSMYVRKEALLSSQIEGTQSSLSDLLLFEDDELRGIPLDDVREVSHYVSALDYGLKRLETLPISLRLIQEIHGVLLARGRGNEKAPGEFRRTQNWIGGTRPGNAAYVPPPPDRVMECMGELESFLHGQPQRVPLLLRAALAHVQFESIHPFLDGNGRVGRLLITLLLCAEGVLRTPLLYLSLYFKTHRQRYYELLQAVRTEGDWERWLRFFLTGVATTAEQAAATAERILELFAADRDRIGVLGRKAGSMLRVHHTFQRHPVLSVTKLTGRLGLSAPTVRSAVDHLRSLGILHEMTGRKRDRLFVYRAYLDVLDEGTEPLPPR
ncbi:MAG: Fic family protein [bacterium]|nr:Fic family protein [bacterium]